MALVTFEQFMQRALHDPEHGYYARQIRSVGRQGDFTTAPMLSEAPAKAIARWAGRALREAKCRDLIEIGPGEGTLAAAVLRHLPWHLRWRVRIHLVETSAPLSWRQRELLGKRAIWHASVRDALEKCSGNAVIYSNELVDAFAVRRFRKTAAGWQELAVEDDGPHLREVLLRPAPLPDSSGFLDSHPVGQWIEVHDSYRRFLADWLPLWKSGRMLTIDYGAETSDLYHRRPHGSIRAYLLHQRIEGPGIYQHLGRQDLTADVNFTDLMDWSRPWITGQHLMSFRSFLRDHAGVGPLMEESGAGDAFLVLDQQR